MGIINNLIDINGKKINNLKIKTGIVHTEDDSQTIKVLFETPFENQCITVMLTDIVSKVMETNSIKNNTISKYGFTIMTSSDFAGDAVLYFAIGY